MGRHTDAGTTQARQPLDDAFAAACDLAAGDLGVTSVHVVVNRQLTYDDLLRYRLQAAACNLSFVVTKTSGGLGFRLLRRPVRQSQWT